MLLKKTAMLVLALMVLLPLTLAATSSMDEYIPEWYESWDGDQQNILENFWDTLNPLVNPGSNIDPYEDADVYGWYKGTFFGLSNWEREVCLLDVSSEIQNIRSVSVTGDEVSIYTTTLTVAAKKTVLINTTLYEVSWYVRPMGAGSVDYRVYLMNANSKQYFEGSDTTFKTAGAQGISKYDPRYLNDTFTDVVIEYKLGSSTKTFTSRVV